MFREESTKNLALFKGKLVKLFTQKSATQLTSRNATFKLKTKTLNEGLNSEVVKSETKSITALCCGEPFDIAKRENFFREKECVGKEGSPDGEGLFFSKVPERGTVPYLCLYILHV